jgi:hypothetical protein
LKYFLLLLGLIPCFSLHAAEIYIAPSGNDSNPGTIAQPIATLARAQELARAARASGSVTVLLRDGTYYLPAPLVFTVADSGTALAPVIYQAYQNERPVISGGIILTGLNWQPYQNGIMQTSVPADLQTDQLFVNGQRQVLARYPNYDPKQPIFNGYAADAISPSRVARWSDPAGGFLHVMHPAQWGDFSYVMTGKNAEGQLTLEGGWQNNRPVNTPQQFTGSVPKVHPQLRFVENIFEELDAPGEWFLNTKTHTLYFYPPAGLDLNNATIETPRLKELVEFQGTPQAPVKFVSLKGIIFRHALRTFMETREPILRSDWALYRGGAILFAGAEDCSIEDSFLDQLGGNAIFVSNYNRRVTIRGCHIFQAGANGVVFLGDPAAARSALFGYDHRQDFNTIDKTPGPQTDNYPAECLVDACLIHETGRVEKQTSPIDIDLAQDITVRHCSLYDCPRAGINIGDGCWGGHVIEFCDIFDTVKETGDNGSFNSWGRDRWWGLTGIDLATAIAQDQADLPRLDAVKPIILRNNRWRCDNGWDIDLDDGSSNYQIIDNLCLNRGIKNREGFYRDVENNVIVNNSFHAHVWYSDSQDVFAHNIIWGPYRPTGMPPKPWGKEMDDNFIQKNGDQDTQPATQLQSQSGRDEHSLIGDAMFIDPAHGNYDVKDDSPVLALGFVNFPMDQFGVQKPELKALARTPLFSGASPSTDGGKPRDASVTSWRGAQVRNIKDEGEMSVYGLPGVTGVLVLKVDAAAPLAQAGLQADDVILSLNSTRINQLSDLLNADKQLTAVTSFILTISRKQRQQTLTVQP